MTDAPETLDAQPADPNPPRAERVSSVEVAKRAEVSPMTVSRVFSGKGYVAPKTRERVLRIAMELGYQPNRAARALRTGRNENIAYLTPSVDALQGVFHMESLAGFESVVSARTLNTMITIPPAGHDLIDWAAELLESGRCGGLAAQLDEIDDAALERFARLMGPVTLINYTPHPDQPPPGVSTVGFSNRLGVARMVRHLADLGHRRVAYIGGNLGWHDASRREEGFRQGMRETGLELNEQWLRRGDFAAGFATGGSEMDTLLAMEPPRPTAVICASDELAAGAMRALRKRDLRAPKDISLVGFDNHPWSEMLRPGLTTVDHPGTDLGRRAAEILLDRIENPGAESRHEILETHLIKRRSSGPPPRES